MYSIIAFRSELLGIAMSETEQETYSRPTHSHARRTCNLTHSFQSSYFYAIND